ncbi:MAG: putative serine/threonine-protein kinase clkA [Parcubacteria group bacterium GW2011_GWB1_43_66]|nr:MAG: putative serine/threonine-protein kinase clkA [Parcubacteria group bacterium GW2011_GWB1_43_66]
MKIMWLNKELKLLRVLKKDSGLNLLRQQALKEQLLSKLDNAPSSEHELTVFSWGVHQHTWAYAVVPIVFIMFITGTIFASAQALPGEPLYGVKRLKERVESAVVIGETAHANIEAKHAQIRLEEMTVITTHDAHVQLEKALNVLSEVNTKLETRGEVQAASKIKETINALTTQATETRFEVQREKEHGRYEVKLKPRNNDSRTEENDKGNDNESSDRRGDQENNRNINDNNDEQNQSSINENTSPVIDNSQRLPNFNWDNEDQREDNSDND